MSACRVRACGVLVVVLGMARVMTPPWLTTTTVSPRCRSASASTASTNRATTSVPVSAPGPRRAGAPPTRARNPPRAFAPAAGFPARDPTANSCTPSTVEGVSPRRPPTIAPVSCARDRRLAYTAATRSSRNRSPRLPAWSLPSSVSQPPSSLRTLGSAYIASPCRATRMRAGHWRSLTSSPYGERGRLLRPPPRGGPPPRAAPLRTVGHVPAHPRRLEPEQDHVAPRQRRGTVMGRPVGLHLGQLV